MSFLPILECLPAKLKDIMINAVTGQLQLSPLGRRENPAPRLVGALPRYSRFEAGFGFA